MRKEANIMTQTKQDIIDAFFEIYRLKRIEKITVKEIIQKAGYNRSTFYDYFEDVYDVLEQVENSIIPTLDELPPIQITTQAIGMPFELFVEMYEQNNHYYSILLGDNGDPAFASKLKQAIKPLLHHTLQHQVNINTIELDFILEYLLSAMIGTMSYWFDHGQALSAEQLVSLITKLMEQGVPSLFKEEIKNT